MKSQLKISFYVVVTSLVLGFSAPSTHGFALLGPFEPWMEYTNDLRQPGDIGGPMDINSGYRWNVPVVTYGFDQSFLDYFGTNGVAAVKSAIQILNDLPPASQIVLTNYPFYSEYINYQAGALGLLDLKSETLSLLLEQMGLASPTRYACVLRQWDPVFVPYYGYFYSYQYGWPDWVYPDFIAQRNFDPQTLEVSPYVNDTLYSATINSQGNLNFMTPYPVDPYARPYTTVSDDYLFFGGFFTGLTCDDVGGLAFLLSTNNVNYETLLPGIYGVGTNADSFVNGAWRSGVDKITFVPQPVDSPTGTFLLMTNQFTDTYITNGNVMQQQLVRVTSRPDFLFCAGDLNSNAPPFYYFSISRTGTTNWINNATLNGNSTGAGPGVIQPPIKIIFNKTGPIWSGDGRGGDEIAYASPESWASFDSSTNDPIIYPVPQSGTNQFTVRMSLVMGTYGTYPSYYPNWFSTASFEWNPTSASGAQFLFQTSTNLVDWVSLFTVKNDSSGITYFLQNPRSPSRFYRLVPQ